MTYILGKEHLLDRAKPGLCRGGLKHVIRRQTRPWTRSPHEGLLEERYICQRCSGVALDWDGPILLKHFDPPIPIRDVLKAAV